MPLPPRNLLLVEGKEDQYAIASLMSHHVSWGSSPQEWPVRIKDLDGVENLLADGVVSAHAKQSGLENLGIMLDADLDCGPRWERLQKLCREVAPECPASLPPSGMICEYAPGRRLGAWVMPDNRAVGMLETMLALLVPSAAVPLWEFATGTCGQARDLGAPFHSVHVDKARLHTWLAWQDPPGQPLGRALLSRCLSPDAPAAGLFVQWFKTLYGLP
jgi:hypothetical protein